MMKYIEYIWLAAAVLLAGALIYRFETMTLSERLIFGLGVVLAVFNYNFRRLQRIKQQKADQQKPDDKTDK